MSIHRTWTRMVAAAGLVALATTPGCFCRKAPSVERPGPVVRPVCLEASPRLNWFDGRPNTLYVRLFQLSTPDAFHQTDAPKLLDRATMLPGVEGAVLERTLFPGTKETVELRQHPDATMLGVVAGYFKVDGAAKAQRKLPAPPAADDEDDDEDDEAGKKPAPCIVFGPNGIEEP